MGQEIWRLSNELLRLGVDHGKKDKNGLISWNACLSRLGDRVVVEEQELIKSTLIEQEVNRDGEEIVYIWRSSLSGDIKRVR